MSHLPTTRRDFITTLSAWALAGLCANADELPVTGPKSPDLQPFDDMMTEFLATHEVPGASLAISRHGKLVYAKGFGYADSNKHEPIRPRSLFRIASISKPITAVAVLQLVEKGSLRLESKVF